MQGRELKEYHQLRINLVAPAEKNKGQEELEASYPFGQLERTQPKIRTRVADGFKN